MVVVAGAICSETGIRFATITVFDGGDLAGRTTHFPVSLCAACIREHHRQQLTHYHPDGSCRGQPLWEMVVE